MTTRPSRPSRSTVLLALFLALLGALLLLAGGRQVVQHMGATGLEALGLTVLPAAVWLLALLAGGAIGRLLLR